jgi:guanidinoacetate N-methyltransferase
MGESSQVSIYADIDPLGWRHEVVSYTEIGINVGHFQVMQYWERPIMRQLAAFATRNRGRILEIGFGLGISADCVMEFGCDEYVIIEAHPTIAAKARAWAEEQSTHVSVVEDFWQNVILTLGQFDGIIFDTYPMREEEKSKNHFPFIPVARRILRPEGVCTYYSDETRQFRPDHLQLILDNFDRVELSCVDNLIVPEACEYWKYDHMVIPCLSKPRS